MRLGPAFDPLRARDFRLLFASRTISIAGGSMADVALAFAVLDLGRPRDLGFVIVARELPMVLLLLLGGVWSDRLPRHFVLVSCDLVRGGSQAATAALLLTHTASVVDVALLQVAYGGASAFGRPAFQGLVPQVTPVDRLQEANALLGLSNSVVQIAGPAVGAIVVAAAAPGWALGADALTFFVSAGLLARIDLERVTRIVRRSLFADFRDGWREFASRSWLVGMVVGFAIFQLTFFPVLFVLGPYVAKTDLGGPGAWGAILAVESAGAVIGGFAALRVRFTLPLVAMVFLVVPAGLEIVLLGLAAPLWVIAAVAFASGACLAVNSAVWFSTLQEKIPQHAISRVSSFDWFASVAFNPIGYVLVGPLSESIGVGKTLVISGLVNVATTIALLAVPTVRSLHSGPEAEAAAEPG